MLLELVTLCTIPVGLCLLPWSDAEIERVDRDARALCAYAWARIRHR